MKFRQEVWAPYVPPQVDNVEIDPLTNKYHCPTCGRGYANTKTLRVHRQYECTQPRYFTCYYCGQQTLKRGNIIRHIGQMHRNQPFKYEIIHTV